MGAHLELIIKTTKMTQEESAKFLSELNSHWHDEPGYYFVHFEEIDQHGYLECVHGYDDHKQKHKPETETWFGEKEHPKASHWGLDLDEQRKDPEHWVGIVYNYCDKHLKKYEIEELLWG